jgi:hypothetical protein
MALTSQTTLDLAGQTATLSYYQGASLIDQITFANNAITYQTISTYNLSKSDMALYYKFLNAFYQILNFNFPIVSQSLNLVWPLCQFDITESTSGVTHIIYTQASQGTSFLVINYVPIAAAGSFSSRTATTISLQEFIFGVTIKLNFFNQVALN